MLQVRAGGEINVGKEPASPSLQESHMDRCCEVLLARTLGVQAAPAEEAVPQAHRAEHRKNPVQEQHRELWGLDALAGTSASPD